MLDKSSQAGRVSLVDKNVEKGKGEGQNVSVPFVGYDQAGGSESMIRQRAQLGHDVQARGRLMNSRAVAPGEAPDEDVESELLMDRVNNEQQAGAAAAARKEAIETRKYDMRAGDVLSQTRAPRSADAPREDIEAELAQDRLDNAQQLAAAQAARAEAIEARKQELRDAGAGAGAGGAGGVAKPPLTRVVSPPDVGPDDGPGLPRASSLFEAFDESGLPPAGAVDDPTTSGSNAAAVSSRGAREVGCYRARRGLATFRRLHISTCRRRTERPVEAHRPFSVSA